MSLRTIVRWIAYVALVLTPLGYLPILADRLEFPKELWLVATAGVALVLFLIDMVKSGRLAYRSTMLAWPMLGLVAASLIATVTSVHRWTSLLGTANERGFAFMSIAAMVVLFFLLLNTIDDRGKLLRTLLAVSGAVVLLIGVIQVFRGSVVNTVGTLNSIGMFAAVLIPLLLTAPRVVRWIGIAAAFLLLAIINWGPVWIVAFVGMAGTLAFASPSQRAAKMKLLTLPLAVIVVGAFLWIVGFQWTSVKSKLPVEVAPTQATSYRIAFAALKARPLGYGLENYVIAYDAHRPRETVNNQFFQARFLDSATEVTTMIVEGGILMALAFLGLIAVIAVLLVRSIRAGFDDPAFGKLWASVLAIVVSFFLYPVPLALLVMLVGVLSLVLLAGLSDTLVRERSINLEEKSISSVMGSVTFVASLVLVLAGGYLLVNATTANIHAARAATASDRNLVVGHLVSSINWYPHDLRQYRSLSQVVLQKVAEDLERGPQDTDPNVYHEELRNNVNVLKQLAHDVTQKNPTDSDNWINRGYIYQNLIPLREATPELAIEMYREALTRSPANALAYARIGNVHLARADELRRTGATRDTVMAQLTAAEESYQQAIALYQNYGHALYNLAAVYDRRGEVPAAVKQFERLWTANPRDPSVLFQLGLLYYRNNQKDNAVKAWEQAVVLFKDFSNARWYLSLVYEERGDLVRALEQVREIEKHNKDNELVKARLAQLEAGTRLIPPAKVLDQQPLNNAQ